MKHWFLIFLAGWVSLVNAAFPGDDELLPADQAFAFSASMDGERIRAVWNVADGYYLYKSKIRFNTDTPGVRLGEPVLPPGKVKDDEFFGKIETYRHQVVAEIPVTREPGAPSGFDLKAVSQGCADIGVCYPPQTQVAALTLPASAPVAAAKDSTKPALKSLSDLGASLGFSDEDELLPADQAFQPSVKVSGPDTLTADWRIADGYYLYRHRFEFSLADNRSVTLLPAKLPEGEHKTDEFFGEIQVYHREATATLPLKRTGSEATPIKLTLKYQGCAERGVCYPPMTKTFDLVLPAAAAAGTGQAPPGATATPGAAADVTQGSSDTAAADSQAAALSEQDAIARQLTHASLLATLLAFFGFGLLLAFTPCVFPMIPILSSIIVGQGENMTARRGFVLSLVYVLAMALTYTVAGVFAGLFGDNLQATFQNPWILSTFAAVFVLLALSMFGFYDLQMPGFIQGRLSEISNRQQGGSLTGVAIMGFLSALIVGPCVAAPLAGALIYIGQTGDAVLGGFALFALSMGMGAPLIAIGTGAGKLLPKAGPWMDAVKGVFGVLLLGVAIWMLERILPAQVTLALWAGLLILSSVYLRALDALPVEATGWTRLWKGVGVVSLVYGVLLLIGAASGAHDPLRPLAGVLAAGGTTSSPVQQAHLPFKRIKSVADLDRELAAAQAQGQPVMVDFYADWCVSCKEMEKYTFADAGVHQALADYRLLQADVTANDATDKALMKRFNLIGPPSILFFDSSGKERTELALVGFKPADAFVEHVRKLD
jgi:thiol:disulfide interchange protein DsbD